MFNNERLDKKIIKRGFVSSRSQAKQLIEEGSVAVNGKVITKASHKVDEEAVIATSNKIKYVSRGGLKLEAAIKAFNLNVNKSVILDVGASTGGFTDCLIQHNVSRVYSVDVGHKQLLEKLKNNPKVHFFENTDIRSLPSLMELVDFVVIDVSFISLRLILPSIPPFLKSTSKIIALIKPQFEGGKGQVTKRGIIKKASLREKIVEEFLYWAEMQGWITTDFIESPIKGKEGNIEYF